MTGERSISGTVFHYIRQGVCIVLPVLLLFGLAEMAARIQERRTPPLPVDIGQGFDRDSTLFVPAEDGFMETNPDKGVSFQYQRFALRKPPRTLRLFALGGSSVNYLDYEFSQLRQDLETACANRFDHVEIINCGGLSYGTHRLVLIAAEIVHYDPDIVLLYSGHNEFEEVQQMRLANLQYTSAQRLLGKSALFRLIRDFWARRRIATLQEASDLRTLADSIPDSSKAWLHPFTPEEVRGRMDAFKNNLESMAALFSSHKIPLILGTVPSNLFRPNLPGADGTLYEEVIDLFEKGQYAAGLRQGRELLRNASPRHQSSDAENEIMREVARKHKVPLADVEAAIVSAEPNGVPGQTLFNDHCHLNPEGNKILRLLYQQKILDILRCGDASEGRDTLQ
ncbi:MAG: hypothetical protein BWX80_00119 [Candidatus Hydrogenedentes bacterium ADurb.Bin101]|nr:MAG: hypothetical protein BWX80_00119 [Candidatus Hydrogenedentes bacterium ADurb.Bin101]HOC69323.1 SGNH/GDSL hydrolase family protein [Candidatus Hydrogenedentota bacterium]